MRNHELFEQIPCPIHSNKLSPISMVNFEPPSEIEPFRWYSDGEQPLQHSLYCVSPTFPGMRMLGVLFKVQTPRTYSIPSESWQSQLTLMNKHKAWTLYQKNTDQKIAERAQGRCPTVLSRDSTVLEKKNCQIKNQEQRFSQLSYFNLIFHQ